MGPAESPLLAVELVFAASPSCIQHLSLQLPAGATVADALQTSGWAERLGLAERPGLRLGIWGRPCEAHTLLRDRDRIEIYRPLQVDPKEARRQRYRRDGMRRAPR
jgi:uncharacterized protein